MADVTLRFYGRLVIAQRCINGKPQDPVTFLAARFKPPIRPHHVLMSAPRDVVSTHPKETTIKPALRLLAAGDPRVTEHFVWDLSGCDVTADAHGPLTIVPENANISIADLQQLESLQGRDAVLDQSNLRASSHGKVSAAIKLSAGNGTLRQVFPEFSDFVPLDKKKPPLVSQAQLADVVDMKIALAAGRNNLKIHLKNGRASSQVTINAIDANGVPSSNGSATVTFTNLCSTVPHFEKFDLEFGQYYELLKRPAQAGGGKGKGATRPDRLIPQSIPKAGEGGDCNAMAFICYY
jgi:hypothetical protein